jgi:hypothetical protein
MLTGHAQGTNLRVARLSGNECQENRMFGKIAGAFIGSRVAGRHSGAKGALLGVGLAALARRGLGPLGLALGAGWAAKKLYEKRQAGRAPVYPSDLGPRT